MGLIHCGKYEAFGDMLWISITNSTFKVTLNILILKKRNYEWKFNRDNFLSL